MNLSPRLKKIVSFIDLPTTVADIGTDHAYIPIYLAKYSDCPLIIASDYNQDPYQVAKNNVKQAGVANQVEVRLGSGLTVLNANEVDTAIIAGMGGQTIKKILTANYKLAQQLEKIILQPMAGASSLRKWLVDQEFAIIDEGLVQEKEKLYQIIVVEPGKMEVEDEFLLELGPKLITQQDELLDLYFDKLERNWQVIIDKIVVNAPQHSKIKKLKQKIERLKEVQS
ncbi:MAG: tRNA (adenine(22)-N(1))-methyltransferase [Bacillota bacterium]